MYIKGTVTPSFGYLYIYVGNETPNIDVFFDNLQVTHTRGPLLEETHYYPFGLPQAGISSKSLNFGKENKIKYNGYEQTNDFDLNLYESFYRTHDPQLGRFWQIDPKPDESVSLHAAMNNNPLRYSDPLGDTIIFTQAFLNTKFGQQVMGLYKESGAFRDMLSQYDIGGEGGFWGKVKKDRMQIILM
jgi:RHS repeat-associated protein